MLKAVVVIPARFNSTRFPGKPLALLKEKPLIQYVYEQATSAKLIDTIIVATDDKRIFDRVSAFGGMAVMTSPEHASGTDRIAEVAKGIDCDIIVNVQGDEPFIKSQMVDDVVKILSNDPKVEISTLVKATTDIEEIFSPNVVKVVMDNEGFAMYFSRSPIPYFRDKWELQTTDHRVQNTDFDVTLKLRTPMGRRPNSQLTTFYCYKHIGIYGYRKDVLLKFAEMEEGGLEKIEKLEQLRALAAGIKIKVGETVHDTFGIDTIEDLKKAEEWLNLSL